MNPKEFNQWRLDRGYTQGQLGEALGVAPNTIYRWEAGTLGMPPLLPLALKGLSFTHGGHCNCARCLKRYPREETGRLPRETRPQRLKTATALVPAVENQTA